MFKWEIADLFVRIEHEVATLWIDLFLILWPIYFVDINKMLNKVFVSTHDSVLTIKIFFIVLNE